MEKKRIDPEMLKQIVKTNAEAWDNMCDENTKELWKDDPKMAEHIIKMTRPVNQRMICRVNEMVKKNLEEKI